MIKLYKTIAMDPPWMERGGGKVKRGADRHYPLVPTAKLPDVIKGSGLYYPDLDEGCSLWMWATANFLGDAIWLMRELGAQYVTNAVWVKEGPPGLGQRFRMMHEHLLYGRIGYSVPVPPPANRLPSVVIAPRGRHSEKPAEAYRLIETHDAHLTRLGNTPHRLEMFARVPRPGWDVWRNEVATEPSTESGDDPEEDVQEMP